MEITLHPNGDKIKIWWQDSEAFGSGHFGPILVDIHEVTSRSVAVRSALTELSRYFEKRLFKDAGSKEWEEYSTLMVNLTDAGAGLYVSLLENGGAEQENLRNHIDALDP